MPSRRAASYGSCARNAATPRLPTRATSWCGSATSPSSAPGASSAASAAIAPTPISCRRTSPGLVCGSSCADASGAAAAVSVIIGGEAAPLTNKRREDGRMPEGNGRISRQKAAVPSADALLVPPQHFYRTSALPCPYLDDRFERKL